MEHVNHFTVRSIAGRRKFLRIAASGVAAVPLGAMAPASWRTDRSSLLDALGHAPICRVAAGTDCVAPGATPREIKMIGTPTRSAPWACPVAEQRGFFAKRNIKVENVNFAGAADQLLEALASGKADAGVGMAWVG